MEAAQNRRRDDSTAIGQSVTVRRDASVTRRLRKPRPQAAMWPAAVVMRHPSRQDRAQMRFIEGNEKIGCSPI